MSARWTAGQAAHIAAARELQIASVRADGSLGRPLPIWVVCVDGDVYVRTWYRRATGWFGAVTASGRARVRVPGLEAAVVVEDVGDRVPGLRAAVDAAYLGKYGPSGHESMVTDDAAATTLRLTPA